MEIELIEQTLKRILPVGSKVYTVRVGSKRHASELVYKYIVLCADEGQVKNITLWARKILGLRGNDESFVMRGYGYNMAGDIVEKLSQRLWNDEHALRWEGL